MQYQEHYTCTSIHLQRAEYGLSRLEDFNGTCAPGESIPRHTVTILRMLTAAVEEDLKSIKEKHLDEIFVEDPLVASQIEALVIQLEARLKVANDVLDTYTAIPEINTRVPAVLAVN
jgi:hypothetical protein